MFSKRLRWFVGWAYSRFTGQRGQSLLEYSLLVALLALIAVVGIGALGNRIVQLFQSLC